MLTQSKITLTALIIAFISVCAAAYSIYQTFQLSSAVKTISQAHQFEEFLIHNARDLNNHIDVRIDAFIDRRKLEKINTKFETYENAVRITKSGKHIYGQEKARFTLVEYSDLECPYCKRFHSIPKEVVDASNGIVNWEWKHFPLPSHNPVAAIEAQASECVSSIAGNRAFWVYLHQIFEFTKGNGQGAGDLMQIAADIGVDGKTFSNCLNEATFSKKVTADMMHAKSLGINSTPVTFIVDNLTSNSTLIRGLQSPEAIVSTIQKMKKESVSTLN